MNARAARSDLPSPLETQKIQDVRSERNLSSKLDSVEPAVPQQQPKLSFGIRRNTSHRARTTALSWFDDLTVR
jgi:hypothetical protein